MDYRLFFSANNDTHGYELWRSDGTATNTQMVKDIYPSNKSSFPEALINVNGVLYFSANDGAYGRELWRSDGSAAGTAKVEDIHINGDSSPKELANVGGALFFSGYDGVNSGRELWKFTPGEVYSPASDCDYYVIKAKNGNAVTFCL